MRLPKTTLSLATAVLFAPALAQEPSEINDVFVEVLDVRVVNVEVVVTDKKGNRVHGMARDSFRLLVDGEEVPIDYFSEVSDGTVQATPGESDSSRPASLEVGEVVGTHYLVFVDDQFTIERDRNRVLDRVEEDLSGLGERDRLALVSFDGDRLDLLTGWTNSESALEWAFRSARGRPAYGDRRLQELTTNDYERNQRRQVEETNTFFQAIINDQSAEESQQEDFTTRLDPVERYYARQLENQIDLSVSAAVASLRAFSGPPGRKVMLLLGGSWPFSPTEFAMNHHEATPDDVLAGSTDTLVGKGSQIYGSLVDTANLLGFTLYPVDVDGLVRRGLDETLTDVNPITGESRAAVATGFVNRELQVHDSLEYIAERTGGEVFLNAERDFALEKAIDDTRSYYWLGFSPDRRNDDQPHDLRVELTDPALRARARLSFLDFSREAEQTLIVESAVFFGETPSKKPLEIRFGKPEKAGRGRISVPLEIGIPMEEITLIPTSGLFVANLEYRVTVMDENGARSQTPTQKIRVVGEQSPLPGAMHRHETSLLMRKRRHRVVIAITDPLSGALLSSTQTFAP